MSPNCLNCGTSLSAGQHFCAHCGQKADTHRISLHEITHDAVHYVTHADKGIFHLLKELATHPGRVASEYMAGKRKKYFKPLNFFLIVAGLVAFMTSTFYKEYPRPANRPAQASAAPVSPEQIKSYKAMGMRAEKANKFTGKYSNVINMLAVPLLTIFFWLCYSRGQYSYLEHLVANMYFVPFVMIFYALLVVPLQRLTSSYNIFMGALGLFFLAEIAYRSFAYYQFMGKKRRMVYFQSHWRVSAGFRYLDCDLLRFDMVLHPARVLICLLPVLLIHRW